MFVNITWADPNEEDILGQLERARRATICAGTCTYVKRNTLPTAMKNYAIKQVKRSAMSKEILEGNHIPEKNSKSY